MTVVPEIRAALEAAITTLEGFGILTVFVPTEIMVGALVGVSPALEFDPKDIENELHHVLLPKLGIYNGRTWSGYDIDDLVAAIA